MTIIIVRVKCGSVILSPDSLSSLNIVNRVCHVTLIMARGIKMISVVLVLFCLSCVI